ncbi:flagellar export chaperone FliS [Vallitalea sp.]|jgi:flagellar protein FliS|uniref:flagellar export chaperone FliS n=1 Tax=Vallitalea sp. TaxID=1882829 RepID=UPI0025E582F7|nr:flagellar protein FliS [Vallitalea sp.]MCT4687626.1 flagellar protein FliS [Vallitalea sp.]
MVEDTVKIYQNKIISAGREQLLIITYELFISEIDKSIEAINNEDEDTFNHCMTKVHKSHRELTDTLDMSYEISRYLLSLYIYMNKKLIESSIQFNIEPLIEVKKLADILLEGFKEAAKGQNSQSLIKNSQKLYAGLTYGKGTLNETIINKVESRGFKA